MKEKDFQGWVVATAQTFGWRVWHVPTPMRPIGQNKFVPDPRGRGLSDLIMLHDDPARMIFAELKGDKGVLSVEQREFLRLARQVATRTMTIDDYRDGIPDMQRPFGVYIWRPGNEDLIEATLRGKILP